ncbi:Hypothetical predicted protein [Olea europaea subsp. europaea]|uniref:Uncharacterized protein n=1 Tax=Olea europaea subsp. europaea TaxID=158383 RepID=A0A8S0UHI8_OLEEU|nr:Hypothetical predicted protein [Olea europaea subsp. europaea]
MRMLVCNKLKWKDERSTLTIRMESKFAARSQLEKEMEEVKVRDDRLKKLLEQANSKVAEEVKISFTEKKISDLEITFPHEALSHQEAILANMTGTGTFGIQEDDEIASKQDDPYLKIT